MVGLFIFYLKYAKITRLIKKQNAIPEIKNKNSYRISFGLLGNNRTIIVS